MDIVRTGWRFPLTIARRVALGVMFASLVACAQHPAGAQDTQEKAMQGRPPTDADVEAAGNRAAADSDAAAAAASVGDRPSTTATSYADLPPGPALTAAELMSGFVRVAAAIASAQDTSAARVSEVSGWKLKLDERGERAGIRGQLGQGHYELAVWKTTPNIVGYRVELTVNPRQKDGCELELALLQQQLQTAGFEGKKAPRFTKPLIVFRKAGQPVNTYVNVLTDDHDAPQCAYLANIELESTDG
jgi:hypothetical protein